MGFECLDSHIQRWVWSKGWTSLRDAQEQAIPALINADRDVIIAAATAAGKTEAAFLPILTNLLQAGEEGALVLYISPLIALINDQWDRLTELCESLEVPVVPWHGDISQSVKQRFLKYPRGVLLITPESLEAMCVRRGTALRGLFAELRYIVIDELHAFIGSDRGKQVQSLLTRIEAAAERRVARVGLSATLGDMRLAAEYLRPLNADVTIIQSKSASQDLKIQIRGYEEVAVTPQAKPGTTDLETAECIAGHLYKVLRGTNNLVFPNRRSQVELYSDLLRRRCEREGVPNEFWPHHGSLSREIREDTERALKEGGHAATAICTSTLELGIDIGSVKSVAQIGAPPSVAGLRQRLGRSGRRAGESPILHAYCIQAPLTPKLDLSERLRENLVQTIASVRLLGQGWFEPPMSAGLHLSTLVQQVLSVIAERGGIKALDAYRLYVAKGPFNGLLPDDFASLLRELARQELIVQESSGLLLLGERGESLVNSRDFYAAFTSEHEWEIVNDGRAMGSLPLSSPVWEGQRIIFAGRRWRIVQIESTGKILSVVSDPGGQPPKFESGSASVHDRVREEMKAVLAENEPIGYLDATAQRLLSEARSQFTALKLSEPRLLVSDRAVDLLTWRGDPANETLSLLLRGLGLETTENEGLYIATSGWDETRLLDALCDISNLESPDLIKMLEGVDNLSAGKWDWALPKPLLLKSYVSTRLDVNGAKEIARSLIGARQAPTPRTA
jgi:ATP-dependent Lhr-like helicase